MRLILIVFCAAGLLCGCSSEGTTYGSWSPTSTMTGSISITIGMTTISGFGSTTILTAAMTKTTSRSPAELVRRSRPGPAAGGARSGPDLDGRTRSRARGRTVEQRSILVTASERWTALTWCTQRRSRGRSGTPKSTNTCTCAVSRGLSVGTWSKNCSVVMLVSWVAALSEPQAMVRSSCPER